ncbi:MAG: YbaK/EbsC family protein [Bacillota bacterium]
MTCSLHPSSQKVQEALRALGSSSVVVEVPESTATSAQAARAVGASAAQIAKSLIFMAGEKPVMVIASGANRVDVSKLADLAGGAISKADAEIVREATGFAIGGVPPVGLRSRLPVFIDRDLLQHNEIWAAAGTSRSLFKVSPSELVRLTGGTVADVAERHGNGATDTTGG